MRNVIAGIVIWVGLTLGAQAQGADIQATIDSQLDAFRADDFGSAFTFASPNLRTLFRTPENFRRMVTQGYPMVWRPSEVRYLDLRETPTGYGQKVMITDRAGRVHILDYRMIETPEGWRINGVELLDSAGANV